MNQKQANRVVKLIDFFESLEKTSFKLAHFYHLSEKEFEKIENKRSINENDIKNILNNHKEKNTCGTYACFAGWLPNIFPRVFRHDLSEPRIKSIDDVSSYIGDNIDYLVNFFGLDSKGLNNMVCEGTKPNGDKSSSSDKKTVVKWLYQQLKKNGYEVSEV